MKTTASLNTLLVALACWTGSSRAEITCGGPFTSACVGDTDHRYDPTYTNNVIEQAPVYQAGEGYWIRTITAYDGEGNRAQTEFFDPLNPTLIPFDNTTPILFENRTISGSRTSSQGILVFGPASNEFCQQQVPEGKFNTLPDDGVSVCGVTGFAIPSDVFETTSYEKDGSLVQVPTTGDFDYETLPRVYPVNDKTIVSTSQSVYRNRDDREFEYSVDTFMNDDKTILTSVYDLYLVTEDSSTLLRSSRSFGRKVSKEVWESELQKAYEDKNVPDSYRVETPTGSCVGETFGIPCPTEDDICQIDPECSTSIYQEPPATIKAGPVAGIVVAGFVVLVGFLYLWHRWTLLQQEKRAREFFCLRITENINLRGSIRTLTPEALAREFNDIDKGLRDGGDGFIKKEDLWEFLSSGKAGEMDKHDFDALFSVMDKGKDGKVDFCEFVAFLSTCGEEFRAARGRKRVTIVPGANLEAAARRLSIEASCTRLSQHLSVALQIEDPSESIQEFSAPDKKGEETSVQ